ncbi:MAG: matrixin family metalloprotease, partial [Candidatus Brocadiae bacterium]|nr:matrixin family metalloprotease [Candidatus Brocadiia bacterium]
MKPLLRVAAVLAVATALLLPYRNAGAYAHFGGQPKWGGAPVASGSGGNVTYHFNVVGTPDMPGGPATLDGEWTVLTDALNDWEVATGGNLDFEYGGTTTNTLSSGDGTNTTWWNEASAAPSGVLATAYTSTSGGTIITADVVFDADDHTWSSVPLMRHVALHEYGHTLGMAHSTVSPSIMYFSVGSPLAGLQADDIAGAIALYGDGGGPGDGVTGGPPPPPPPPP